MHEEIVIKEQVLESLTIEDDDEGNGYDLSIHNYCESTISVNLSPAQSAELLASLLAVGVKVNDRAQKILDDRSRPTKTHYDHLFYPGERVRVSRPAFFYNDTSGTKIDNTSRIGQGTVATIQPGLSSLANHTISFLNVFKEYDMTTIAEECLTKITKE